METPPRRFYTVNEAKTELRVGHTRIYQLMKAGAFECVKLGGKTLIPVASLERYITSLPKMAA